MRAHVNGEPCHLQIEVVWQRTRDDVDTPHRASHLLGVPRVYDASLEFPAHERQQKVPGAAWVHVRYDGVFHVFPTQ